MSTAGPRIDQWVDYRRQAARLTVTDPEGLPSKNTSLNAFVNLAGPSPGIFDWGLPFFFGRTVFTAIEGQSTPGGTGPYWAF